MTFSYCVYRCCEQNTFPHCMYRHKHFVCTSHMMLHSFCHLLRAISFDPHSTPSLLFSTLPSSTSPTSHVPSQAPGLACRSSALSYSLQTELGANCADPRSGSWFDRMAEQSPLTGTSPVSESTIQSLRVAVGQGVSFTLDEGAQHLDKKLDRCVSPTVTA